MPVGGLTTRGPRNLLRQIREAMAGAAPAQERLDTVVRIISVDAKAGSKAARPSCAIPISGVAIDWWAPPSGASVTPDGVATRRNRASW